MGLFWLGFVSVLTAGSRHRGCGSDRGASAGSGAGREGARPALCVGRAGGRGGGSRAFTASASGPGARLPPGPGERRGLR